jgi:Protein of unknown function (DUF2975)
VKPETEAKLKKIKRVSNVLRVICKLGMIITTCVFTSAMVLILTGHGTMSLSAYSIPLAPLTLPSRLVLATIMALAIALCFKYFYHIYQLLGNYGRGDIFTTESANHIRQLGITVMLLCGPDILWAIAVLLMHVRSTVQFNYNSLVTGLVIIIISWFMEMAAEMREENELTI